MDSKKSFQDSFNDQIEEIKKKFEYEILDMKTQFDQLIEQKKMETDALIQQIDISKKDFDEKICNQLIDQKKVLIKEVKHLRAELEQKESRLDTVKRQTEENNRLIQNMQKKIEEMEENMKIQTQIHSEFTSRNVHSYKKPVQSSSEDNDSNNSDSDENSLSSSSTTIICQRCKRTVEGPKFSTCKCDNPIIGIEKLPNQKPSSQFFNMLTNKQKVFKS